MTPRQERMIVFLSVAATLVGQKLLTDGRNMMMAITMVSSCAKGAEDLWGR